LSLRHGKNWHCRIFTNDNGQYYITNNHAFRTVPELIDFYSKRCVSHDALDAVSSTPAQNKPPFRSVPDAGVICRVPGGSMCGWRGQSGALGT
jgi:hypothetical protein